MADDWHNLDLWITTPPPEERTYRNPWRYAVCKRDHRTYTNMTEKQLNNGGCYDCVWKPAKEHAA